MELIHLGGGETLPCPDAETLPLDPAVGRAGLGTARLALPSVRVHVIRDAVIRPTSGVVTTGDGRIVAESVTAAMVGRVPLDDPEMRARPVEVDGTLAVFRSPLRSTYHTLVDDLPRAGLLIHPALARLGPVALVHDGELSRLESGLLAHLGARRVSLREVEPGRPVRAERVVIPNFVTRPGAGAVPRWYRRWSDGVPLPSTDGAPRRIHLDGVGPRHGPGDRDALADVLARHDITSVDVSAVDDIELLGMLRDAEVVVGPTGGVLSTCLFSRAAHVVELLDDVTLDPAIYYLAVSKGLPYDFVPAASSAGGTDRRDGAADTTVDLNWLDRLLTRIG